MIWNYLKALKELLRYDTEKVNVVIMTLLFLYMNRICFWNREVNTLYSGNTQQYVEAIKLATGSVQYKNLSVKQTFFMSVKQLYEYYKNMDNACYLEIALLHIQAYLEMGFPYDEGREIFDPVIEETGSTKELTFPNKFYVAKTIKLNRTQVRSMIRKWPPSPHQTMKIDEVVDDIISKVKGKENGIFYYKCAATKDIYELVISEKETFFHDMQRGIFYTFLSV